MWELWDMSRLLRVRVANEAESQQVKSAYDRAMRTKMVLEVLCSTLRPEKEILVGFLNLNSFFIRTSTLVFPGTGTGALNSLSIHVSISLTSFIILGAILRFSGIRVVKSVHTQSLKMLFFINFLISQENSNLLPRMSRSWWLSW